jgi:hypothetical protein
MSEILLVVTIDTEEDQWLPSEGPFTVSNVLTLPRLQTLLDHYGVVPTYLVNYPVAADPETSNLLARFLGQGRCEIGTHLHPWSTPPVREEIGQRNSMLSNLPYELQQDKISFITEFLEKRFGMRPMGFRAGRYGLGKDTARALKACRYEVDTSVTPFVSWKQYEGPSFESEIMEPNLRRFSEEGSGIGSDHEIFEVPATIGYSRWPFRKRRSIEGIFERLPACLHAKGLASRLNWVRRISLSPESENLDDMLTLSRVLIDHGTKVLNMFFHSNSLVPGLTPYTRSVSDVDGLYRRLSAYFENLLSLADVKPIGLTKVRGIISGDELKDDKKFCLL